MKNYFVVVSALALGIYIGRLQMRIKVGHYEG